jgi:ATP adenylyltransferase
MEYILERKPQGCIFCAKLTEKRDEENLILYRGKCTIVLMNKFPYNNGHLMVIPRRHCVDLEELNEKELHELSHLLKTSIQVLKTGLRPHGFNIGLNLGKAGGAGEEHLHFHIVPRWAGDTNFMPVLGETKIIPEYLVRTYRKLRPVFEDFLGKKRRKGDRKG